MYFYGVSLLARRYDVLFEGLKWRGRLTLTRGVNSVYTHPFALFKIPFENNFIQKYANIFKRFYQGFCFCWLKALKSKIIIIYNSYFSSESLKINLKQRWQNQARNHKIEIQWANSAIQHHPLVSDDNILSFWRKNISFYIKQILFVSSPQWWIWIMIFLVETPDFWEILWIAPIFWEIINFLRNSE